MLRHCHDPSVRQTLYQLPESLNETYLRALSQIPQVNKLHAYRMLQYLLVAVRPLRLEELSELLAVKFDAVSGEIQEYRAAWGLEDHTQVVLSACSSLVTIVNDSWPNRKVIQFSHFSVKEFLMSDRLTSMLGDFSRFRPASTHDAAAEVPTVSKTPTVPQSSTGASEHLPAVSLAPVQFPFGALTPSRSLSPAFPEHVQVQKPDGDSAIAPLSTLWNSSKRKCINPIELAEGYTHTRSVRLFLSAQLDRHPCSAACDRGHWVHPRCGGKHRPRGALYRSQPHAICARGRIRPGWPNPAEYLGHRPNGRGEHDRYPIRGAAGADSNLSSRIAARLCDSPNAVRTS